MQGKHALLLYDMINMVSTEKRNTMQLGIFYKACFRHDMADIKRDDSCYYTSACRQSFGCLQRRTIVNAMENDLPASFMCQNRG